MCACIFRKVDMRIFVYRWYLGFVIQPGVPLAASDFDLPDPKQQIEIGGNQMTMINLREYYPDSYTTDCFIAVPDEIAETLRRFKLEDEAYRIRTYRNKAYFSLDYGENIEREAVFLVMTPADIWDQKEINRRLHEAMSKLTPQQKRRIYARFFLHMNNAEIARTEGCDITSVRDSINRGLRRLKKIFENLS